MSTTELYHNVASRLKSESVSVKQNMQASQTTVYFSNRQWLYAYVNVPINKP